MCALWTKSNPPRNAEQLRKFLPRNLSTSDSSSHPFMHRLYAWQDPPLINANDIDCEAASIAEASIVEVVECSGHNPAQKTTATIKEQCPAKCTAEGQCTYNVDCATACSCRVNGESIAFCFSPPPESDGEITTVTNNSDENSVVSDSCSNELSVSLANPSFDGNENNQHISRIELLHSPLYQENEYHYYKPKRSSSLKTKSQSPGTPERKMVRFADAFGLDLEKVKHIFDSDNPPKIPASAVKDLRYKDSEQNMARLGSKHITPCFQQPGSNSNFLQAVLENNVSLENAFVEQNSVTGTVRVKSLTFNKTVVARVTYTNWSTFTDISASYVQNSHDGLTDRFSFSFVIPPTIVTGDKVQFAIRFETENGKCYWDNNFGQNYIFECIAKISGYPSDGSWMHFL